jgi:hypothetical protein
MDSHLVTGHHVDALYDIYFPILRPVRSYEVASANEVQRPTSSHSPKLQNAGQT